ncbi:MAG: prepilin-type N-terminal cleavage/methylation domain-containing protein [Patescibacteria group bacterium]|nr:prepilin-type N-terminal cleavage/methylation domain-containing protein [Patescibacteria group bacterium]
MNFYLAINIFKTQIQRFKKSQNSFTLVELLITIAILAVLSTAVLTILNPQEYLRQSRDSQRLKDLTILSKIISWFETDTGGKGFMGTSSIVYVSIPDTTSTCANLGLPPLPSPWQYRCTTAQNLQKIDGTGWIPIDFNQLSFGRTLSKLPIDPINTTSSGNYYTYVTGGSFELTAFFESNRDRYANTALNDGDSFPGVYSIRNSSAPLTPGLRDKGLVGYWSFDEGSGTIAYDRSGYNNNGTLINGPT